MSRKIGTPVERATVECLVRNGFPYAERRALHGSKDLGDITGTPGLVWEVKGGRSAESASDGQVLSWLNETEQERVNANADYGILVLKRKGIGIPNAEMWWAIMPLHDWQTLVDADADPSLMFVDEHGRLPVRMHLRDAIKIFRARGYGDPL